MMSVSLPVAADPAQEIRIPCEDLQSVMEQLLIKGSMFQFDASIAAQRVVEADLYGSASQGCAQFCRLLNAMEMGDVDPRGRMLTIKDAPSVAVLDGSRNLGQVAG